MRSFMRKQFKDASDFGPLRMRLQRFGQANFAFYNIVVAQARFRRNGRVTDYVGAYCPHATVCECVCAGARRCMVSRSLTSHPR